MALAVISCVVVLPIRAAAPPLLPSPILTVPHDLERVPYRLALSPDGKRLLLLRPSATSFCNRIEVWDIRAKKRLLERDLPRSWGAHSGGPCAFTRDGSAVVVAGHKGDAVTMGTHTCIWVVEVPSGKIRKEIRPAPSKGMRGGLGPGDKCLVLSSDDEAIALYDLETGKETARLKGPEKMPHDYPVVEPGKIPADPARAVNRTEGLVVSRDGKWAAVLTEGHWLSVWDVEKKKRLWRSEVSHDTRSERVLDFSPDGAYLARVASRRDSIQLWDRARGGIVVERALALGGCPRFVPGTRQMIFSKTNLCGFVGWDMAKDRVWGKSWAGKRSWDGLACNGIPAVSDDGKLYAINTAEKGVLVYEIDRIWPAVE